MKKLNDWIRINCIKQIGFAEKIGVSTSTLHEILRNGRMPTIITAYEIEKFTDGEITIYDWLDEETQKKKSITKNKRKKK